MEFLFAHAIITQTACACSVFLLSYGNTIFNQSACIFSWGCFLIYIVIHPPRHSIKVVIILTVTIQVLHMMVGRNISDEQLGGIADRAINDADLDRDGVISFDELKRVSVCE